MPFEITMPQLGLTMEKGTMVEWLAGEGDQISIGQEIFQVETDKSIVAVEAHEAGTLARILVGTGQEVAVGTVLAVGVASGETLPVDWQPSHPAVAAVQPAAASQPVPVPPEAGAGGPLEASWKARVLARQAGLDLTTLAGQGPRGRIVAADIVGAADAIVATDVRAALATREEAKPAVQATPVAANLAEALGLDLAQVRGSGPGGRIDQQDVLAAAAALIRGQAAAPPAREPGLPQVAGTIPLQSVRKLVSEGMARSVHTTARVTLFREVDAG
ncbi:MAG: E3 binding domain-containing protein, partial [Anaerolineae bacterium]|nr:E3 binding domain-containing protein [Anaerolineae bacterium]